MDYEIDPNIERVEVRGSHQILDIGYDKEKQELWIRFHNDDVYKYSPVPLNMWMDFKRSESKGKYFYKHIKSSKNFKTIKRT